MPVSTTSAGVDLSRPIDEPTQQALSSALANHLTLVLRDQSLTPALYLLPVFGLPGFLSRSQTSFALQGRRARPVRSKR